MREVKTDRSDPRAVRTTTYAGRYFSEPAPKHEIPPQSMPAYTLPPNAQDISVLRMVVKENFSRDIAEMLSDDIDAAIAKLGLRDAGAAQ